MTQNKILAYSRIEMLFIRNSEESRTRPSFLHKEFDTEDGLFSPDKWLQNIWKSEGIEVRLQEQPTARKKSVGANKIIANAIGRNDETILSPQRRLFSSGCKAPITKSEDDKTKSKWRAGQGSNNFKPDFQKSRQNKEKDGKLWSSSRNEESVRVYEKTRRNRSERDDSRKELEETPEWLDDGPSSMNDMIELKGFDEDMEEIKHPTLKNMQQAASVSIPEDSDNHTFNRTKNNSGSTQKNSQSSRQTPSTESENLNVNDHAILSDNLKITSESEKDSSYVTKAQGSDESSNKHDTFDDSEQDDIDNFLMKLPTSDAEFADLLGISLDQLNSVSNNDERSQTQKQPSFSRLSQFFSNANAGQASSSFANNIGSDFTKNIDDIQQVPKIRPIVGQGSDDMAAFSNHFTSQDSFSPLIQKLFTTGSSLETIQQTNSGSPSGSSAKNELPRNCYTLEEIERSFSGPQKFSSGFAESNMPPLPNQRFEIDNYFQQMKLGLEQRQTRPLSRPGSANFLSELMPPGRSRFDPRLFSHAHQPMGLPFKSSYRPPSRHGIYPSTYNDGSKQFVPPSADSDALRDKFNRHLIMRARMLQPNPNLPIDFSVLRSAFFQMMQDSSMRALLFASGGFIPPPQIPSIPPPLPHSMIHHSNHNHSSDLNDSPMIPINSGNHHGHMNMPNHRTGFPYNSGTMLRHHGIPQMPNSTGNRSSSQLNSTLMPTSVMRNMSKVPPILDSYSSLDGMFENSKSQKPHPFLQQLFSSAPGGPMSSKISELPRMNGLRLEEIESDLVYPAHTNQN